MLRVSVMCVGRLRESWYVDACREYEKRLGRYCTLDVTELPETSDPEKDGALLLSKIPAGALVIAMCIEGKLLSSEGFSRLLADWGVQGRSRICFLIGGSQGLSRAVKERADVKLSMSPMTFPHHLARVMVLEQLYRAFNLLGGGKYHK